MNTSLYVMCIGIICLVAVAFSGCVGTDQNKLVSPTPPPTPIQTPVPVGQYVFTEAQNGTTVYLNLTNTITLKLKENPSTGYSWALTTTNGLKGTGDFFVSSDTTGRLSGAGGTHYWNMIAAGTGVQKISGVYQRSWEPLTGNETRFDMTIVVV